MNKVILSVVSILVMASFSVANEKIETSPVVIEQPVQQIILEKDDL